jgi:hypothetical protein
MTAPARGSRLALLALLVLLGALLVVPAVTPTASADRALAGRIAGKVTGAGGLILPGVTEVYVLVWDADASGWSSDGPRVFADDQGHYEATGLVAGTYRLMFEPQGVDWLSEWWIDAGTLESATDIVLTEGEQRTGVDAELRPAGHIVGTAHRPDGSALTSIDVIAWPSDDGPPNGHGRGGSSVGLGQYRIDRLAPGTYRVQLIDASDVLPSEFWNDAPTFAQATDVVVGLGQTVTLGDSVLGSAVPPPVATPAVIVANTARPTIAGRPVVGRRLTANAGSWSPTGVSFTYQWFAGGKAIKGATKAKLKLTTAERGKKITVQVTASSTGAAPATASSRATTKVRSTAN